MLALLKAIDILACAVWLGVLYPFGLAARPTGRQMISSYVGEAAAGGNAAGRRAGPLRAGVPPLSVSGRLGGICRQRPK